MSTSILKTVLEEAYCMIKMNKLVSSILCQLTFYVIAILAAGIVQNINFLVSGFLWWLYSS